MLFFEWLDAQTVDKDGTTHCWFASLPPGFKESFGAVANEPDIFKRFCSLYPSPAYSTAVVASMNETCVAANKSSKASSDNVFYSNQVDGPFMCFPFASVYTSTVAVNSNHFMNTIFPSNPAEKGLTHGDMWAFHFNREVHRIEMIKTPRNRPNTLKLHYIVFPSSLPFYGHLLATFTSWYDPVARLVFLKTLKPKNTIDKLLWGVVMICTKSFYESIRQAGNSGAISYIAHCAHMLLHTDR